MSGLGRGPAGDLSGTQGQSGLSGAPGGGSVTPGQIGGPGLDFYQLLAQVLDASGTANVSSLQLPLGAGGLTAGALGQTPGQNVGQNFGIAGNTQAGAPSGGQSGVAGQTGGSTADRRRQDRSWLGLSDAGRPRNAGRYQRQHT